MITRITTTLAGVGLASAMLLTGSATAQFGEAAGIGEVMNPYFLRRDLTIFANELELDEGQKAIIESFYWDYEDSNEADRAKMLERFSAMREELQALDKDQVLAAVLKPFEDRVANWDRLNEEFLANVQAILNEQQLEEWDSFQKILRREKELSTGRFSGESVDLFNVVKRLDLDRITRSSIDPALADYADRLDEALRHRERLLREGRLVMMSAIKEEKHQEALDLYERQVQARIAVRDVNNRSIDVITSALPAEEGASFRQLALELAYPRIYRETAVQRLFQAVKKLPELPEQTLQAVVDLEAQYLGELHQINENLRRMTNQYEPEEYRHRALMTASRGDAKRIQRPEDPTRAEFRRRAEVDRKYADLLRALLSDEQFEALSGADKSIYNRSREPVGEQGNVGGASGAGSGGKKGGPRDNTREVGSTPRGPGPAMGSGAPEKPSKPGQPR